MARQYKRVKCGKCGRVAFSHVQKPKWVIERMARKAGWNIAGRNMIRCPACGAAGSQKLIKEIGDEEVEGESEEGA